MYTDLIHLFKESAFYLFLWIAELGYWGIMLGLMIEIIPSEVVLSYGGYLVSQGQITFLGAVIFGTIGGTLAQIFVYWMGKYGGRPFLEKYGKYMFIHKKHIDLSEKWFHRYGTGMIFTARFIPIVRHAISIPAGMARMSLTRFTILTTLAIVPWSILFISLGKSLGDNWQQIDEIAATLVVPFSIASILLTFLYLIIKMTRRKDQEDQDIQGDKIIAQQLKLLGREYKVLHHRWIGSGSRLHKIDYIVIGPNGVFYIEVKHGSGEIRLSEYPIAQMYRHEYAIKDWLRQNQIQADVVGIICFTHQHALLTEKSPAFTIIKRDGLLRYIQSYKSKRMLSLEKITTIHQILEGKSKSGL